MLELRQSILKDYELCTFLGEDNWGKPNSTGRADEEELTNKYAMTGIIFHEVCEEWGRAKMLGTNLDLDYLHGVLDYKINNLDETLFNGEEEIEKYRVSLHEQLEWTYLNCLFNEVTPLAVELKFSGISVFEGLLPFCGTIDRVIGNVELQNVTLEDYKTGKVYTKNELKSNIQACIYSLAFYNQFGFMPKEFVFYFTKHKKIKRIQITEEFIKESTNRILALWHKIINSKGEADGSNAYFCKNFCSSLDRCPKFNKNNATKSWDNVQTKR